MKNKIMLNEAQFLRIVSESVKNVLNEIAYDPDDYYGPEEDEWETIKYETARAETMAQRILDGDFDEKIFDDKWADNTIEDSWNSSCTDDGGVCDAIENRRKILSKDYALDSVSRDMKSKERSNEYIRDSYAEYGGNQNRFDRGEGADAVMGRKEDKDIEFGWFKNQHSRPYNPIYKKNGELRSGNEIRKRIKREFGWDQDADKKPLHRKGSANRDLMNMK